MARGRWDDDNYYVNPASLWAPAASALSDAAAAADDDDDEDEDEDEDVCGWEMTCCHDMLSEIALPMFQITTVNAIVGGNAVG